MSDSTIRFDSGWKNTYEWANSVPGDVFKTYCLKCKKIFPSNRGEETLKEHEQQHNAKSESYL